MFQPRKYKKKELLEIFRTRNDNALLALIDSLWREYPAQWKEQKLSLADIDKADPEHADYDPRYKYVRNDFRNADNSQTTSYATAHGFGHVARADFAQVFGFFNYALSFFQTTMGPFAKIPTGQTPDEWVNTDLLYVLGNGQDDLNRSNVVEIFKSGLVHWHNAQVVGAYEHGNEGEPAPELIPGLIQYTAENGFECVKEDLQWHPFGESAYEIAVRNGFVGTEIEWLASLNGDDGNDGAPGSGGKSAYEVAVDNGFVGTEAEWLASLEGADGDPAPDTFIELTDTPASYPGTNKGQFAKQNGNSSMGFTARIGEDAEKVWIKANETIKTVGDDLIAYPIFGYEFYDDDGWDATSHWEFSSGRFRIQTNTGTYTPRLFRDINIISGQNYKCKIRILTLCREGEAADFGEMNVRIGETIINTFTNLHPGDGEGYVTKDFTFEFEFTATSTGTAVFSIDSNKDGETQFQFPQYWILIKEVSIKPYTLVPGKGPVVNNETDGFLYELPSMQPDVGDIVIVGENNMLIFVKPEAIIGQIGGEQEEEQPPSIYEVDPFFAASPAYQITSANIANWTEAYGWGNHADGNYLTSITKAMVEAVLTGEIASHTHPDSGSTIPGTETLSGTSVTVSWNGKTAALLTLTGATTLTFGTPSNYVKRLFVTGDYSLTLPASAEVLSGEYDGTKVNIIDLIPSPSGTVYVTIN